MLTARGYRRALETRAKRGVRARLSARPVGSPPSHIHADAAPPPRDLLGRDPATIGEGLDPARRAPGAKTLA